MKQIMQWGLALVGASLGGGVWAGREAIQTEQPVVWYAFDNSANGCNVSSGASALTFSNTAVGSWGETDDRGGGYIIGSRSRSARARARGRTPPRRVRPSASSRSAWRAAVGR